MIKTNPATRYSYTAAGSLIRVEAITSAGVAGVWYVTAAEALNFAIKQAAEQAR